jgi:two-component system KDP operon response regulator KdpE
VILDLGLPDISGLEVIKQMREWTQIPVIIISVREQEQEKIAALDAGADDYLTKPFGMGELVARIRVVLRRQIPTSQQPIFQLGELKVDLSTRLVSVGDKEIQLTPTEYDILRVLVQNSGKVITNQQMLHKVWGEGYDDLHILRVNISNLRSKLEPNPSRPTYIHTEPGVGYRLHN